MKRRAGGHRRWAIANRCGGILWAGTAKVGIPATQHSCAAFSRSGGSAAKARSFDPATRHSCAAFSRSGGSAAKARSFDPATQHSCAAFSRSGGSAAKASGFDPATQHSCAAFSRSGGSAAKARSFDPATRHSCAAFSRFGGSAAKARSFDPATQHSCAAFSRSGGSAAKASGFTLVEVLLATVLLAAGLALAFATLSAASQTATRGESLAARSERVRAVEGFLRKRLAAARPIAFSTGQDNALPQRFLGEPERMRFVADLPDYLGRGGPYSHDVRIQRSNGTTRIELVLDIVSAGETIEDPRQRAPELLVEGLASARFRYRGLDAVSGGLGAWQDRWDTPDRLPLLVEVTFTDVGGGTWPTLVVALPQAMGVEAGSGVVGGWR